MGAVRHLHPPWQKGQSGNPGGRAKLTPEEQEARRKAREFTPEGIDRMIAIIRTGEPKDSIAAYKLLLTLTRAPLDAKDATEETPQQPFTLADRKAACLEALAAIEREEKGGA